MVDALVESGVLIIGRNVSGYVGTVLPSSLTDGNTGNSGNYRITTWWMDGYISMLGYPVHA